MVQDFLERVAGANLPFWVDFGLSPGMVVYAAGLAVLAALIVGVLPALQATGRRVQAGLQQLSTRGSQMQLGRTWTVLIVMQVAIAVAVMPFAVYVAGQWVRHAIADAAYPAGEFLRASLTMERDEAPPTAEAAAYERAFEPRFRDRAMELLRRLEDDPAVAGVTFANEFPGIGWSGRIELEGAGNRLDSASEADATQRPMGVLVNEVDVDLFTVFAVPILTGRGFVDADSREGSNTVIVNQILAQRIGGGGNVLGRRVRLVNSRDGADAENIKPGPWLEIVGVVPDFTVHQAPEPPGEKLYQPLALAQTRPGVSLALRIRGDSPIRFAGRVRDIAAAVDPALHLDELRSALDVQRDMQRGLLLLALAITAVTLSVLLLSAAGIYAMMSFTVAKRRREIGIRSALGADPRRILSAIFARASAQLGAGVLTGLIVASALFRAAGGRPLTRDGLVLLSTVAALMMLIGLLAALGPARRGLAVQPTEALREE